MRHRMIIAAIGLAALIVPVVAATAQIQTSRRERVTLAAGSTSTTIKGAIRSHETIDYLVGVKAGQPLTMAMTPAMHPPVSTSCRRAQANATGSGITLAPDDPAVVRSVS